MPRCPIVTPDTVRIYFADVSRRAHLTLDAKVKAGTATQADLDASQAQLAAAEANGDYIDVKKELNTGEYRKMINDQYKETEIGNGLSLDLNQFGMSRVLAYVLGWSFVGLDGKPLTFSESALKSFDIGTWQEILGAVDTHHAASEKTLEARKNGRGTVSESSPISPSPSGAIGPSTPSVN